MQQYINLSTAERIAHAAALIRGGLVTEGIPRLCIGTGVAEIDADLPWGGLPCGLHEIAAPYSDIAKTAFAVSMIGRHSGPILWCRLRRTIFDTGDPYGPGIAALGLSPDQLILVEADKQTDLLWAMEEGAKTKGLGTVVVEGVMPDLTASRRLQLAAEAGGGLVFLLQSGRQVGSSSALTRWFVESAPSLPEAGGPGRPIWKLQLWRCRGGGGPREWMVEWNDAALSLSLVPAMANRLLATTGRIPIGPPGSRSQRPGWNPADCDRSGCVTNEADRWDDPGRRAGAGS
jgi:protein ImuA